MAGVHRRRAIRIALEQFDDALKLAFGPEAKVADLCSIDSSGNSGSGTPQNGGAGHYRSSAEIEKELASHSRSAKSMLENLNIELGDELPPYAPLSWSEAAVSHEQDRDGDG